MAVEDDLASEVQTLSSRLLEAEDGRSRLESQLRQTLREQERLRIDAARAPELESRVAELEAEMAEFSSNLLEEANRQVADANRRVAKAHKYVEERDSLLETQQTQIDVLKAMVEAAPPPKEEDEPSEIPELDAMAVMVEYGAYASPIRPVPRFDTSDFTDFCALAGQAGWKRLKFAVRAIAEEIEPTMRLDTAQHVSWLSCRSWLQATLDGNLVLEPVPRSEIVWASRPSHPCVICGENRPNPHYARLYQARVPRDAQPYALGLECHARVRLACEYSAFLRSIASGMRHMETMEQKEQAWRDCLLIRERLFWSRSSGLYPPQGPIHPHDLIVAASESQIEDLRADDDTDNFEDARERNTPPSPLNTIAPSTPRESTPIEDMKLPEEGDVKPTEASTGENAVAVAVGVSVEPVRETVLGISEETHERPQGESPIMESSMEEASLESREDLNNDSGIESTTNRSSESVTV